MATLERAVLANSRTVLKNPELRMGDILEWSTGKPIHTADEETEIWIADPGVWICVLKNKDLREGKK